MIEGRQEVLPSAQKRAKSGVSVKLGEEVDQKLLPEIRYPIPRLHLPSLDMFQQHVNGTSSRTPLIITGAIDHWPARERWTDLNTICRTAGPDRLVPIEIGSKYTDVEWTQKLVTMHEFIEQYIIGHSCGETGDDQKPVGYLAQHDLFDQIPRLRRDIDIPDYCM
ncbi:Lysine-specific demethylase 8, partial [Mortierella sp. NVP85]